MASSAPPDDRDESEYPRGALERAVESSTADEHPCTGNLLWAAYRGMTEYVIELLDEEGVPINSAAPDGRNALYMAVLGEQDEMEALLRARGAVEP